MPTKYLKSMSPAQLSTGFSRYSLCSAG